MQVFCLGFSYRTASIELRERLAYSTPALQAALAGFSCEQAVRPPGITELVILSTCNRLELYASVPGSNVYKNAPLDDLGASFARLLNFVIETRGLPGTELEDKCYRLVGEAAIQHLGRVAAGLDSMILGEPQILGQLTEAYHRAWGQGAAGPVLSALFRTAIRVGKRARTETSISRNPATISSVAVKVAEAAVGRLSEKQVLILGAGEMAELAVEALRARGVNHITVVNRTQARAIELAQRWEARALSFERLSEALAEADVVITSTQAPHFVITPDLVRNALIRRPECPLVLIDIAVPRNIDPEVHHLPGVHHYDIDDLQWHLNGSLTERERAIPEVESIVAEEIQAFLNWLRGLEVTPLIVDLRAKAETIRRAELQKTLRRMPHLGEVERQHIETLTEALINKLLHAPTLRLKSEATNGHAAEYAAAIRYLFALNE